MERAVAVAYPPMSITLSTIIVTRLLDILPQFCKTWAHGAHGETETQATDWLQLGPGSCPNGIQTRVARPLQKGASSIPPWAVKPPLIEFGVWGVL